MAHIQLASSLAYLGQLGETCGCGFLDFFFFVSKKVYNKLYVLVNYYVVRAIAPLISNR